MLNISKHKVELTQILLRIYKDSFLAQSLGFKGGTAAYLFYNLPRFSTDLDFDLLGDSDGLEEKLTDILKAHYEIRDHRIKRNTIFWLVSYEKGVNQIKIEISTREFPNKYEIRNLYGTSVKVITLSDMIAHKLVAIEDRNKPANRDLFDAHYFLSSPQIFKVNYDIIYFRTKLGPKEFYKSLLKHIEKVDNKKILQGLGEVLTRSQKDWAKNKLLSELKGLVELQLDSFNE